MAGMARSGASGLGRKMNRRGEGLVAEAYRRGKNNEDDKGGSLSRTKETAQVAGDAESVIAG